MDDVQPKCGEEMEAGRLCCRSGRDDDIAEVVALNLGRDGHGVGVGVGVDGGHRILDSADLVRLGFASFFF